VSGEPQPKPKPKRKPPTAKRQKEASEQAGQIVAVVEATAIAVAGPEAEIKPIEHLLIDEPLAAVLARIEPAQMERANSILAPVLLACGLALYGARVYGLLAAQGAQGAAKEKDTGQNMPGFSLAAQPGKLRRAGGS